MIASRRPRVDYDPRRPEVIADPFPMYRRLREDDPVHWSEILGGWVVTRYADVRSVLLDKRMSADRISSFEKHLPPDARAAVIDLLRGLGMWAVFTDPPNHTRLRGLMNKAFTSRAIGGLAPAVQTLVDRLIDRVAARGSMDVIADFAYPLPAAVIARLIGIPDTNLEQIKVWSDDLAAFVGSALATPDKRDRARGAIIEMSRYFRDIVADHRTRPRDDVMSALIGAEERGEMLSEDELIATCILLLFAGHETTTNLIGNGLLALLRHPAELAALRDHPELTETGIEELLRYDGPVQAGARVALEDIVIDGTAIARDERVFFVLSAANRDPEQFPYPDRLELARRDNRHLAFGLSIHFCIGAPLARLEGQIAMRTLLRRLRGLRLATPTPEWSDSFVLRGVRALPVAFDDAA